MVTIIPAVAATWAMPRPMVPAPTTPTVTVSGGASSGTDLTVTVDYTYNYLAISNLIGVAPIAMRSTTVMRME